ncbi:MAG: RHS repeat-associated core domain-containing protein [Wenzhouxiangellaceae bacterium]
MSEKAGQDQLGVTEHSGRVTNYSFDDAYRLLTETITDPVNGDYSAEYTYDLVGNRTQSTIDGVQTAYTYDANDRLTQAGGERYFYDANGNTLRVEIDSDQTTYQYDDRNRMVASSNTVGGITTSSSYRYDIDGNRVQQTIDGETTDYTVDRNRDFAQVIGEFSPSRDITYTHGDDLISQHSTAGPFYYHYDGLGSTRALTDDAETVTDTYDYEAFGDLLNQTGFTENNYRFTGEQYDPNLDQYYLRARYYNQNIGRFTQMDAFQGVASDPITLHKYLYASADPVNNIDPSGNFSLISFAVAQDIRSTLNNLQMDVGLSILNVALDPDNAGRNAAIGLGVAALGGVASFKLLRMLSGKFRKACNSFDGDTPIWTEAGLFPISEISIGDLVWAFDEETGKVVLQPVVHTIERGGDHELVLLNTDTGETIVTTPEHPFYAMRDGEWAWIEAGQIAAGDVIYGANQESHVVNEIEQVSTNDPVFNLTVDKDHSYFVGDQQVLAHNANRCQPLTIPQSRLRHVLDGDATGGFHHRAGGFTPSGRKVIKITQQGSGKLRGAYRAEVQICEGGRCFKKPSTFFPDRWSKSRVQAEITQAYNEFIVRNNGKIPTSSFIGKSSNGFPIEMVVRDGKLWTARPFLSGE